MRNEKKEAAEEEEEEEKKFRWLDVVRYAAAGVVALLAVGVLVGAIVVVLRPDALVMKVIHGSMLVNLPPPSMTFTFQLEVDNPSGRDTMSFTDMSVAVLAVSVSGGGVISMANLFNLPNITDLQPGKMMQVVTTQWTTNPEAEVGDYFVRRLSRGETMAVTLRVQGILITRLDTLNGDGPVHTSKANVTYTCFNVKLGVDKSLNSTDDVSCNSKQWRI